jgi:hypothetical protein
MDDIPPAGTSPPRADLSALTDRMTPQLAAGLAKAQAAAVNIANNCENTYAKYKYANLPALLEGSRAALAAGGLAIVRSCWSVVPTDPQLPDPAGCPRPYGTVRATYVLVHESGTTAELRGQCDAYTNKHKPTDKAMFSALTMIERYLRAGVLGIFWDDPSMDVDQRRDDELVDAEPPRPPVPTPPTPPQPKPEPPAHPNADYQAMLVAVRNAFKDSPIPNDRLWYLATGLSDMPRVREIDVIRPHMLRAVRLAAENIPKIEEANAAPKRWTHTSYTEACESLELDFGMRDGRPTGCGSAADELVSGEGPPADGEPDHDPDTGEVTQ